MDPKNRRFRRAGSIWAAFSRDKVGRRRTRRREIGPRYRSLVAIVSLLAASGCGTRLSHEQLLAGAGGGGSRGTVPGAGDAVGGAPVDLVLPGGQATGSGDGGAGPAGSQAAPGVGTAPADGRVAGTASSSQGSALPRAQGPGSPAIPVAGSAGAQGAGSPGAQGAGGQVTQDRSPIVIGSVSNLSGPAGAAQKSAVEAAQIWVRMTNDRNGLDGHAVRYVAVDDGSDPARHAAAVKDLVENQHVLAFLSQAASTTHQGARSYLEKAQVPVIGGELLGAVWYESPMYFSPAGANLVDFFWGLYKSAATAAKGERLGMFVCQEAQICTDALALAKQVATEFFEIAYEGRGSLAQPDFTAECLSMRNNGVDVVMAVFDVNSVKRVAASCARQGFRPLYILASGVADDSFAKIPEFEGSAGAAPTAPFTADSPALTEFRQAWSRYGGTVLSPMAAGGWVAAKLFEQAAHVGFGTGKPSTPALLNALWSMRNETLGGLTGPLTFVKGAGPASQPAGGCSFPMRITDGKWIAPDGLTPTCRR